MTEKRRRKERLKDGDTARFIFLHLNTGKKIPPREKMESGYHLLQVEGKERPMLIIRCLERPARFLALKLTTSGRDERGNVKQGLETIGDCLERGVEDFVQVDEIYCMTANLLVPRKKRKMPPCDPLVYQLQVERVVTMAMKRGFKHLVGALTEQ